MDDNSAAVPQFRQSAEDLAAKLVAIGTAESMGMVREARELAETFQSWEKKKPEDAARILAIRQLFELNRKVMDYLAQRQKAARK